MQHDARSISSSGEEEVDAVGEQGKQRGKLSQLGHEIKEPEKKFVDWVEGEKEGKEKHR